MHGAPREWAARNPSCRCPAQRNRRSVPAGQPPSGNAACLEEEPLSPLTPFRTSCRAAHLRRVRRERIPENQSRAVAAHFRAANPQTSRLVQSRTATGQAGRFAWHARKNTLVRVLPTRSFSLTQPLLCRAARVSRCIRRAPWRCLNRAPVESPLLFL